MNLMRRLDSPSSSLRSFLLKELPVDEDFDAFCVDYYPAIFRLFSRGMSRTEKVNLLLVRVADPNDLIRRLRAFVDQRSLTQRVEILPNGQIWIAAREPSADIIPTRLISIEASRRKQVVVRATALTLIPLIAAAAVYAATCGVFTKSAQPGLSPSVQPPDAGLRRESPPALRRMALAVISQALSDKYHRVGALEALYCSQDSRTAPMVVPFLRESPEPTDPAEPTALQVQVLATKRLSQLKTPVAHTALLQAVGTSRRPAAQEALLEALTLLSASQGPQILAQVEPALQRAHWTDSPRLRPMVALLLAPIRASARDELAAHAQELSPGSREAQQIWWRLSSLGDSGSWKRLSEQLAGEDTEARQRVALRLAQWDSEAGRSVLEKMVQDADPDALRAALALVRLPSLDPQWLACSHLRRVAVDRSSSQADKALALAGLGCCEEPNDVPILAWHMQESGAAALRVAAAGGLLARTEGQPDEQLAQRLEQARQEGRSGSGLLASFPSWEGVLHLADQLLEGDADEQTAWDLLSQYKQLPLRDPRGDRVISRLKPLMAEALREESEAAIQVLLLLHSERTMLRKKLLSTDSGMRALAALRLAQLREVDPLVQRRLREALHGPLLRALRVYGLLRELGETPQSPLDQALTVPLPLDSKVPVRRRQAFVSSLVGVPWAEAEVWLERATRDAAPEVRRQVLDSLIQIRNQGAISRTILQSLLARLAQDPDQGVQFRIRHARSATSEISPRTASGRPRPRPSRSTVLFRAESGVRFEVNGTRYQAPTTLSLPPGPYTVSWQQGGQSKQASYLVPAVPRYEIQLPVRLSQQRTSMLP